MRFIILFITALVVEIIGCVLIAVAIAEGIGQNPAIYIAPMGGLFVVAGGILWVKVGQHKWRRKK